MTEQTVAETSATELSPSMPALDAVAELVESRLKIVERIVNSMDASTSDDARTVHQLRVATRRAAAALKAAVAAAAVAAQAAEQRADVPLKARLFRDFAVGEPLADGRQGFARFGIGGLTEQEHSAGQIC